MAVTATESGIQDLLRLVEGNAGSEWGWRSAYLNGTLAGFGHAVGGSGC